MSWYGLHPTMTRLEARILLGPRWCHNCVYWVRVFGRTPEQMYRHESLKPCPGCGRNRTLLRHQRPRHQHSRGDDG